MLKTTHVLPALLILQCLGTQIDVRGIEPATSGATNRPVPSGDQISRMKPQPPTQTLDVLVTVNGVPLSQADIDEAQRGGHGENPALSNPSKTLDNIIEEELVRQKAVEMGLDADPLYQKNLQRLEAQVNAFKRKALTDLYFRHEKAMQTEVSDAEARAYFDKNISDIQTEHYVWQILARDEDLVKKALQEIRQGASFEDVARNQFPNLPKSAGKPWDVGYLRWTQIPPSWSGVLEGMKKGDVSGIIKGPNRRFWIIKLVDIRRNPKITFESMKPIIIPHLREEKAEHLREYTVQKLRTNARIIYTDGAVKDGTIDKSLPGRSGP